MNDQRQLDELVHEVATRTDRNVTLDDVYGRVLASSTSRPTTDRARIDAVMLKTVPEDVLAWERETGAFARQRPFVQPPDRNRGFLARLCLPLVVRGVRVGYFWILAADEDDDLRGQFEDYEAHRASVDEMAQQVAAALEGDDEDLRRDQASLRSAILGEIASHALGEFGDQSLTVLVVGATPSALATEGSRRLLSLHACADALRAQRLEARVLTEPDHTVFVTPAPLNAAALVARYEASLQHRASRAAETNRLETPFGLSRPFADYREVGRAYGEAVLALQASAVDDVVHGHTVDDAGVYQFIAGMTRRPPASLLDVLLQSPQGHDHALLLERLYDSDVPMQALADDLHMHRTSLYNRLQRIAHIIQCDPMSSRVRQHLHLALKVERWCARPSFTLHDQWSARRRDD